MTSNNDVIIKVGEGSITLKDAKDTSLNIIGAYTPDITPPDNPPDNDGDTNTKKTPHAVLKSLVQAMDYSQKSSAEAVLNEAIIRSSNGQFKNIDELVKQFMSDYRMAVKTDIIGTTIESRIDTFLKDYCGINLNNDDVGAATGSDMGYSSTPKTAESIVPEEGTFYNLDTYRKSDGTFNIDALNSLPDMKANKTFSGNVDLMFTKKGVTIEVTSFNLLSERGKQIISALYSWWTESALNLIQESYGLTFTEKTTTKDKGSVVNRIQFNITHHIGSLFGGIMKTDSYIIANNLKSSFLTITLVKDKLENDSIFELNEINPSGSTSETRGFWDRLFTHEMVHATMMANINHYDELPSFVTERLAEIIIGLDDEFSKHIEQLRNFMKDDTKLKNVFYGFSLARSNDYIGGYMLFRYLAKQVSDNSEFPDGIYFYDGRKSALKVESQFKGTVDLSKYPSTVKHIYAVENSNKMTLIGDTADNEIWASKGGSEMIGEHGDDTLHGGNGSDTFVYASGSGNDVFTGISNNDKIKLTSGTIDNFSISGHDVILKIGKGSITLKNAKGKKLTIIDSNGTTTTKTYDNEAQEEPGTTPLNVNPVISSNIARISARASENVVVTNIDSLDDLTANGTSVLTFTENSGRGIQNINLRSSEYPRIVSLESGTQKIQFNDANGNVAIVGASATGSKEIIFGNGDDLGIFFSSNVDIKTTLGSGDDSILFDNNARVRVDMNKSDKAKIIPYSGRVILDNYNPDSRAEIVLHEITDTTGAIKDNSIQLVGNEIRPNSSTRIQLNDSTDANIINLSTERGDTQKVGFTGINGGTVDAHELRGNFLLKGNYAENASDKQKRKPSTLISGDGHDTILAGARDFVDGGNGRNQIFLTPYDLRQIKDGATIASSGNGRNTVNGFHEGFGYDGDVIQVNDFNNISFKFNTDGLLLTSNDSRLKFDGIGIASATTNDLTNSLGTDRAELIQITNGSSTMRTAVAKTNQSILVQEDDYITPNAFFGNRSGLNFSEYSGSVEINLADGTGKLDKWDATFQGINKLQAGTGMATLIGSDNRDTLIAGDGYSSLWGGKGNDKLIGRASSTDKDGRTTFFFFAGDGHDVIYDFNFLTPQNYYSGDTDKINIGDCNINDAYCSRDDVILALDDESYLTIKNAKEKNFQINHMIAQVGNELHYDGIANTFANSGNSSSSLIVDSSIRSAEIWLDSSHGTQFFGNIRTLDASAVEGNTSLVGNEFDDTIIAGQGDASLWGGFSTSNDLLIGGNSRNTFFYCMGNGNDTIQGINDRDSVILSDVSLDQIIETNITADSVSIRFKDGGSLQILGASDVTYQLADGSKLC